MEKNEYNKIENKIFVKTITQNCLTKTQNILKTRKKLLKNMTSKFQRKNQKVS